MTKAVVLRHRRLLSSPKEVSPSERHLGEAQVGSAPPSQLINQLLIYILFSYIKNLGVLGLIHFHIDGVLGFYISFIISKCWGYG